MRIIDIPHGGSGNGITSWVQWGTGCLIAGDLSQEHKRPCTNQNFLIGTLVHEYLRLWRSGEIDCGEQVEFVDSTCGIPPDEDTQDEALRLFRAYCEEETVEKFGPVIATELRLESPEICEAVGVTPYAATIDLLAGSKESATLVDYKTARASGDRYYTSGSGRIQMVAYYLATQAAGYSVDKIVIEQITKTKTPKVNTYEQELPTRSEINALRNFLRHANHRRTYGHRGIWLPSCDGCHWRATGHCLPGG